MKLTFGRIAILTVFGLGVTGCGAGLAPSRQPIPARTRAQDAYLELQRAETQLEGTMAADCGHACELHVRVCHLSDEICAIAGEYPGDRELDEMCVDSAQRCETASATVFEACACGAAS